MILHTATSKLTITDELSQAPGLQSLSFRILASLKLKNGSLANYTEHVIDNKLTKKQDLGQGKKSWGSVNLVAFFDVFASL